MSKKFSVYSLNHPITNEIRYIGFSSISLEKRLYDHLRQLKRKDAHTYKSRWVSTLLKENLKPTINLIAEFDTPEEAFSREIEEIKVGREKGLRLTNTTDGGEGYLGYSPTPEIREKMGNGMRGKKHSPETCKRLSEVRKGKKFSEEHKRKIGQAHKGRKCVWAGKKGKDHPAYGRKMTDEQRLFLSNRKQSDEQRKKHSERMKGEGNSFYGKTHSEETKKKISIANKNKPKQFGRPVSEETKQKHRESLKKYREANPITDEYRKNLSIACSGEKNGFFGKKHSEETKAKIKATWQRKREERGLKCQ